MRVRIQHNLVAFVGIVVAHSSKPWPSICSIYSSARSATILYSSTACANPPARGRRP